MEGERGMRKKRSMKKKTINSRRNPTAQEST